MSPEEIKFIRSELEIELNKNRDERDKIYLEIARLQKVCPHKHLTAEHKSNTGNYDPVQDSYWIQYRCDDCRKSWVEELDK